MPPYYDELNLPYTFISLSHCLKQRMQDKRTAYVTPVLSVTLPKKLLTAPKHLRSVILMVRAINIQSATSVSEDAAKLPRHLRSADILSA
jgi:hypothetical protein